VPEPVEWDDALVFKATDRAAGYLWYFPRTATGSTPDSASR